jgi:cobalt-precorrin 5A hydrolase
MGVGEAMIVAGIGCRKGARAEEIDAAIETALGQAGCAPDTLSLVATSDGKGNEPGIIEAAAARNVRLVLVRPADLHAAGPRTQSFSPRVKELMGVPSVAEAAALAACGPTATLLLPRLVVGPITCAIAGTVDGQ